jgi:hypothetical protein
VPGHGAKAKVQRLSGRQPGVYAHVIQAAETAAAGIFAQAVNAA